VTVFKKLREPLKLSCVSDAAFRREDSTGLSVRGYVIMICEDCGAAVSGGRHLLDGGSKRQKRVVRATFGAELHSLVDAYELAKLILMCLTEVFMGPMSAAQLVRVEEVGGWPIPLHLHTDAFSVFSALNTRDIKTPTEESLLIILLLLREGLESGRIRRLNWIDTRDMVADGLTKGSCSRAGLLAIAELSEWILKHPHVANKPCGDQSRLEI
jgi:hypothetical protein